MRYRLLFGSHEHTVHDENGVPVLTRYKAGDVIDTDIDLTKVCINKFIAEGGESFGAPKQNPIAVMRGLRSMSLAELKQFAEDEEVDVDGCETPEDYLKAVVQHAMVPPGVTVAKNDV